MDIDTNILFLALGYFIADTLHYIFVVPYVLGLQKKLKDLESMNKEGK